MSKLDAVRAMREARYAEAQTRAGAARPAPRRAPGPASKPSISPAPEPTASDEELCGHRNIGGRTCTRERGHAAKTHRYG
ncbi:hypothetical protein BJ993_004586 [Nocardioides aromaticivorans]|uniref:Uncharacterized protein n=1 Tax=Nocardioides aromaticivorans TaxID=200618 RepID=A0A7Z0CN73_9ACTN|nr:hypothetical protein [Nocardioides aromaticivorans]NYI47506.1 hypothetical protein [Nocardioides aromaticivorans]